MNKKFLSIVAGIALFSSSAFAEEKSGFFIGADAAYVQTKVQGNLKHNQTGTVFNGDLSSSIPILGLKAGYRFNDLHRLYLAYNYSDEFSDIIRTPKLKIEGDFSTHKFLMGYAKTNLDLKTPLLSLSQKFDGFAYGAKIGAILELGASNEIEAGFKVEKIEYNTRDFLSKSYRIKFIRSKTNKLRLILGLCL